MVILGLDLSSTRCGWVVYADGAMRDRGLLTLQTKAKEPLAARCRRARAGVHLVLLNHPDVAVVAFEAAGSRHATSLIVQSEVRGAVRGLVAELQLLDCDIAPTQVKNALGCGGRAEKAAILTAAWSHFYGTGVPDLLPSARVRDGDLWLRLGDEWLYSEHEADALGVALAAARLVVEVTR